jgi:hypothetical protein
MLSVIHIEVTIIQLKHISIVSRLITNVFLVYVVLHQLKWYNKPLASATLVAVPPGGKSAELDPNPNY